MFAGLSQAGPITVGRGPSLGWAAGEEYFEQLQDWEQADVRALDPAGDSRSGFDGLDRSRDLLAFYSRQENDSLYLRFDMLDLALGAENGSLNLGVLIDVAPGGQHALPDFLAGRSAHGWELALLIYDTNAYVIYDRDWNVVSGGQINPWVFKGAYLRSDLDACELGIDLQALRWKGWDGRSELGLQAFSWKDGSNEVADAIGEDSLDDGRLDTQLRESSGAGTAKYSVVLHGNQSLVNVGGIGELIRNRHILTPNGKETGYHRALETHQVFGARVTIHVSGTLASSFAWARHPDPNLDGPSFNRLIAGFADGDPSNGEGALIGGVFSEHILPYFEGSGVTPSSARLFEHVLDEVYGVAPPKVFWSPERVLRGSTFADVRAAGYRWTVIDQLNHLATWYGPDAFSNRGHKINRVNGVDCFVINDDADQMKFAVTDGGTWLDTRLQLIQKALDPDQEQLILVFDDWEAFSGRSFTSFGVGSDNPDNYTTHVRWLANHPWIQVVDLEQVASWGWTPVDRGTQTSLGLSTYHWLQHATERSYDSWYYGSNQEESFRSLQPTLRNGQDAPKIYGDVWTPGTVLHDVWKDVEGAPAGNLKTLAEMTYSAMMFETAWHDEDMHDYHARRANGDYVRPDTTFDGISGWAIGLHGHVREASIVAHAARWAAGTPGAQARVYAKDVDQDGEAEWILENDRLFAVIEDDGGRLAALFARDPLTREGYQVIGAFPVNPGESRESEWEGSTNQSQRRVSGLKDWWSTGQNTDRYVNARYSAQPLAGGLRLTSDDGRIRKTISLAPSSTRLEVRYETDASVGTLYVRLGLSPHVTNLVVSGQDTLQESRQGNRFVLTNTGGGRTVSVSVDAHGAGLNDRPSDGSRVSPRNVALAHQVELSGQRSFTFGIQAEAR